MGEYLTTFKCVSDNMLECVYACEWGEEDTLRGCMQIDFMPPLRPPLVTDAHTHLMLWLRMEKFNVGKKT